MYSGLLEYNAVSGQWIKRLHRNVGNHSSKQHYMSEDLIPQKQGCGNLKSQKNEDNITDKTNLNASSFKSVIGLYYEQEK